MVEKPNRRGVLKRFGITATGLTAAGSMFSSSAKAASTISDSSWADYEPWQEDRVITCGSGGCLSPDSQGVQVPNPKNLGFSICTDAGSGEICSDMGSSLVAESKDCAGGQTIYNAEFTVTKTENGAIEWSQTVWIGVDSFGCGWVGVDSGAGEEACTQVECPTTYSTTPSIYNVRALAEVMGETVFQYVQDNNGGAPATGSEEGAALIIGAGGGAYLAFRDQGALTV
jgi:hypothetical protein